MARSNGRTRTPERAPGRGGSARTNAADEALPDGYDELTFGRVRGWFVFEAGNALEGVLRESFTKEGRYGVDTVYKIQVNRIRPKIVDGETEETVVADHGDVIGLDEKGFLRRLGDVPNGTPVYVKCLGKSPPSEEFPQGAYQFKLGVAKGTELKRRPPKAPGAGEGDDKLPF